MCVCGFLLLYAIIRLIHCSLLRLHSCSENAVPIRLLFLFCNSETDCTCCFSQDQLASSGHCEAAAAAIANLSLQSQLQQQAAVEVSPHHSPVRLRCAHVGALCFSVLWLEDSWDQLSDCDCHNTSLRRSDSRVLKLPLHQSFRPCLQTAMRSAETICAGCCPKWAGKLSFSRETVHRSVCFPPHQSSRAGSLGFTEHRTIGRAAASATGQSSACCCSFCSSFLSRNLCSCPALPWSCRQPLTLSGRQEPPAEQKRSQTVAFC